MTRCRIMLILSFLSFFCDPIWSFAQLDLPPYVQQITPKPEIYYNGHKVTTPLQTLGDVDRDQRFGPPYDEKNSEDGSDDFRVKL